MTKYTSEAEGAFANIRVHSFDGRWCRFAENKFCKVEQCPEMKSTFQGLCENMKKEESK